MYRMRRSTRHTSVMISLLSFLSLGTYGFAASGEAKADLVLTGEITYADNQTYREVPFSVPEGVTRVTVQFSYSGREQRTTIDLGLFDGERFRGWSGGNKDTFTIPKPMQRLPICPARFAPVCGDSFWVYRTSGKAFVLSSRHEFMSRVTGRPLSIPFQQFL